MIYFRSNIKDSRTCRKRQRPWPRPGETSRRLRVSQIWPTPRLISKSKVKSLQTATLCPRIVRTKELTQKLTVVQKRWNSLHYPARTRGCSITTYSNCGFNALMYVWSLETKVNQKRNHYLLKQHLPLNLFSVFFLGTIFYQQLNIVLSQEFQQFNVKSLCGFIPSPLVLYVTYTT